MKEEWTDRLKDRLSGYEENVPEGLWDDIESTLSRRMLTAGVQRKSKARLLFRRTVTALTAAAAAILIFYMVTTGNDNSGMETPETAAQAAGRGSAGGAVTAGEGAADLTPADVWTASCAKDMRTAHIDVETEKPQESVMPDTAVNAPVRQTAPRGHENRSDGDKRKDKDNGNRGRYNNNTYMYDMTARRGGNARSRISLGLYAQNTAVSTSRTSPQGSPLLYSSAPDCTAGSGADCVLPEMINMIYTRQNTDVLRTKHDFPIRAGLSVRYSLNGRIGIESGLTYTLLRSQITSGNDYMHDYTRRQLHYIGIPLSLSCTVWRGKRFEAYLSGGGEIQKCVSGKDDTGHSAGGTVTSSASSSIKDSRLQLSLGTAAGIQYNISPAVGIYAEPGVSWHPDNGSAVETIYKEKPLDFSVKVGVRVNVR